MKLSEVITITHAVEVYISGYILHSHTQRLPRNGRGRAIA